VLIGFDTDERDGYYNNLWQPMEKNCQGDLDKFIRYYLAIKVKASPRQGYLYSDFKDYVEQKSVKKVDLMQEMLEYSKLFARLRDCSYGVYSDAVNLRPQEKLELSYEIQQRLKGINLLYSVNTPFILQCMYLNPHGKLSAQDFATVLERIDTLLLRRWVCGIQSQGLDHWFMSLLPLTEQDDFLNQLDMKLHRTGKDKFIMPNDDNFGKALRERDLFNIKDSKDMLPYIIERLENGLSREWVLFNEYYSIEHIMPQKLTSVWESELGDDAAKIHKEWLHRLANLTLTAYNSVYSNRSFAEKCNIKHGLSSSALRLNREIADIGKCSHWSVPELQQRAESLIAKALKLWPYPKYEQNDTPKEQSLSTETKQSVPKPGLTKTQDTTVATQDADEAVLTPINLGLQQTLLGEDTAPTQNDNSSEAEQQLQSDGVFDYCLAEEPRDFAGTRLAGCEFLGQHYDVKKWAPLQRMLLTQIYQRNPERLRSWLAEKWGKFNLLAQLVTPEPNVTVARADVFEIDKGIYLNSHQPVYDKVKMLKQLFELMEIDPKELTLHIVKMRNKD
ncbi:MAG: HNH endonuclease family protein, partial [Anaerobiospirillum sp.]|nr:HNH endonuclease family protein [Anaerobiospirillum sp.]